MDPALKASCLCVCVVGILLLGFYFSGSKLTKIKANVKLTLDANYKVGGQRSARQVPMLLCSPPSIKHTASRLTLSLWV